MRRVYLDYAASAPVRPEALAAERAYEECSYAGANPNSLHTAGREAARALDGARRDIARCLGGRFRPMDVVFTSGGTENNNLALVGLAMGGRDRNRRRTRVILSAIEHDSGLDVAPALRDRGFEVETVAPTRDGRIECAALEKMLGPDVALVSVMAANNEMGVVQPLGELSKAAHRAGALFYTDAAQGFGKVSLDVSDCDAVGVVGHKIGAPVGTGALVVRTCVPLRPTSFGGGQERGIRPGTQDVRGALALAAAAKASCAHLEVTRREVAERAERLYALVCAEGTGIVPTTPCEVGADRLPGMVSLLVGGLDSETLVLQLDARGFEVSAASACASGSTAPSHVLTAMGVPGPLATGSLRVSFDERVPWEELERFGNALLEVVASAR
ncbi:MAG: cysteine desulfurase [Atopobiaceae bacterium]|nr:cysteine desulfurase [Atopobiaceae bacterium]